MVGASVSGSMEIFYNDGQLQTPNYVAYTDDGVLVGHQAKEQALANPKNTIFDVRYAHRPMDFKRANLIFPSDGS